MRRDTADEVKTNSEATFFYELQHLDVPELVVLQRLS